MDCFLQSEPMEIDLVYADKHHPENIFGIDLYHKNARLSLHRDLARIVILAARTLHDAHGWILILKDGLRTVDAQEALMNTGIVRRNPQWLEEPNRLLSPPGGGGHPRGMAIDVGVKGIDMGTAFDEMTPQSARSYDGFTRDILQNRIILEGAFMNATQRLSLPLLPLPSEWWDFRFPAAYHGRYDALRESDLPAPLKTMTRPIHGDDDGLRFDRLAKEVLNSI
jgi:D-alanyl-D-alanine dipeptidase